MSLYTTSFIVHDKSSKIIPLSVGTWHCVSEIISISPSNKYSVSFKINPFDIVIEALKILEKKCFAYAALDKGDLPENVKLQPTNNIRGLFIYLNRIIAIKVAWIINPIPISFKL